VIEKINIISLFPEMFRSLCSGVTGNFIADNGVNINIWNPRDYSGLGGYVDDRPYGGGPGMVMSAPPLESTVNAINSSSKSYLVYLDPAGDRVDHGKIQKLVKHKNLTILCGRYEGVDRRFCDQYVDEYLSLGDFVLSGGELACMVVIDSMLRLVPGCLGNEDSAFEDSFYSGFLDHDHFTRPECFNGIKVPSDLLSGDHAKIKAWRKKNSLGKTWALRNDLLPLKLDCNDKELLLQYVANYLAMHED
jgi:tRNA (guanine37-N1)-methyltransferase